MFVDKTIKAAVKTSAGVCNASKSLVKSTSSLMVNTAVNYTPDFYDEHQDFAKGGTMFLAGNSVMVARNTVRSVNSLRSGVTRGRKSIKQRQIKKKNRQLTQSNQQLKQLKTQQSELNKTINKTKSGVNRSGLTSQYMNNQITKTRNRTIDLNKELNKYKLQSKKLTKKHKNLSAKGLRPFKSLKATVSNQTRKQASMLANKDDFGTKSIGLTIKSVWGITKYGKKGVSLSKRIYGIIKSAVNRIFVFLTSLPAMLTSLVTALPVIVVVLIVTIVLSCFGASTYSGRIGKLYDKINDLNSIYGVEIDPAEVLAITDVLDWTTQDKECYEQLYSLMLDQSKGKKLSFESMAYNVFVKYNPANKYSPEGIYNPDMKTGYYYWSLEGFDINFVVNNPVKRNLLYKEHIELYPIYKNASVLTRKNMATTKQQKELINLAKDKIEINRQKYEDYIYEYNLGDIQLDVTGNSETGVKIVKKALTKLGCRYVWGAGHSGEYKKKDLNEFDCSGLVCWSFYQCGIDIGDQTTKSLCKLGKVVNKNEIQAGDIIVYYYSNGHGHVVMYLGNNKVVHAPQTGDVVKISDATHYLNKDGATIRRLY